MSEPLWCDVRGHYCRCHDFVRRCEDYADAAPQGREDTQQSAPNPPADAASPGDPNG
jgi:hypothetical protein